MEYSFRLLWVISTSYFALRGVPPATNYLPLIWEQTTRIWETCIACRDVHGLTFYLIRLRKKYLFTCGTLEEMKFRTISCRLSCIKLILIDQNFFSNKHFIISVDFTVKRNIEITSIYWEKMEWCSSVIACHLYVSKYSNQSHAWAIIKSQNSAYCGSLVRCHKSRMQ